MKTEHTTFLLCILTGVAYWVLDSVMECYDAGGTLTERLITPASAHEMRMRIIALVGCAVFGGVLAYVIRRGRLAAEAVHRSDARLRTTLRSIGDGVITTDVDGRVTFISGVARELSGWGDDAIGRPMDEVFRTVSAVSREPTGNPVHRVLREGAVAGLPNDTVLIARDGRECQIADSAAPIRDGAGKVSGAVLVFRDVSEAYRRDHALRASEQRYRALFSSLGEGFALHEIICDEQGAPCDYRFLDVNPAFERLTGLKREAILGETVLTILPDLERHWIDTYGKVALTGEAVHFEQFSGSLDRYFDVVAYRPAEGQFACLFVDITRRREAEQRVAKLNAVLRSIRDVNQLITRETERDRLLAGVCECLAGGEGYLGAWIALRDDAGRLTASAQAEVGDGMDRLVEQMRAGQWPSCWQRADEAGGSVATKQDASVCGDCPMLPKAGDYQAMSARLRHGGADFGLLVVSVDPSVAADPEQRDLFDELAADVALALSKIKTERLHRQAERDLHTERDRAQHYMSVANVIFVAMDTDGVVTLINKMGCDVLGCDSEQALGASWYESFVPADHRQVAAEQFRRTLAGDVELGALVEGTILTVSGETRLIAWHNSLTYDEHGNIAGMLSSGHDITEQRRTEEQLRQAQKMEAIGRLAGGIAHDFNNQLTVIQSYCEMLLGQLAVTHPTGECVKQIKGAADRATQLTGQLLAYSRRQVLRNEVVAVNRLLGDLLDPLARMIGEDIRLAVELGDAAGNVRTDPVQLQQVLMNMVVNARDAMPDGGTLALHTERVQRVDPEGDFVMLQVSDTGVGMSEPVRQRVFEPFFTTKPTGQGTGLGLAMAYGFVTQSGGLIEVDSEPGQGACFRVYLPRTEQTAGPTPTPTVAGGLAKGTETVLVAEDESAVRTLVAGILTRCGYTVLACADADEAMATVQGHDGPIDLLVTDIIMPGRSGPELAQEVRRTEPELRILYISGYTRDVAGRTRGGKLDGPLLPKPFGPEQLAAAVREVLDSADPKRD